MDHVVSRYDLKRPHQVPATPPSAPQGYSLVRSRVFGIAASVPFPLILQILNSHT